jgi:hypothetical protein
VYGAIQEFSNLVDGNFEDVYNSQHEIKGSLHDLIQFEAAQLRLEFGDRGEAEVTRLLDARKQKGAGWAAADKDQQNKGKGSLKKKD